MCQLDDEKLKSQLKTQASIEVKKYSWQALVQNLQNLYCELIEKKGDVK